jgi:hypothetical protein
VSLLDQGSFEAATSGPGGFDASAPGRLGRVELGPYAVARLVSRG